MKIFLLKIIFLFAAVCSFAQEDSTFYIKGKIVSKDGRTPVWADEARIIFKDKVWTRINDAGEFYAQKVSGGPTLLIVDYPFIRDIKIDTTINLISDIDSLVIHVPSADCEFNAEEDIKAGKIKYFLYGLIYDLDYDKVKEFAEKNKVEFIHIGCIVDDCTKIYDAQISKYLEEKFGDEWKEVFD